MKQQVQWNKTEAALETLEAVISAMSSANLVDEELLSVISSRTKDIRRHAKYVQESFFGARVKQ